MKSLTLYSHRLSAERAQRAAHSFAYDRLGATHLDGDLGVFALVHDAGKQRLPLVVGKLRDELQQARRPALEFHELLDALDVCVVEYERVERQFLPCIGGHLLPPTAV